MTYYRSQLLAVAPGARCTETLTASDHQASGTTPAPHAVKLLPVIAVRVLSVTLSLSQLTPK